MMGDSHAHLPTPLSVQFLTKNGMTPVPHPPYLPDHTRATSFCFPKNRPQEEMFFASVEERKQKTAEVLKDIKIDAFENCFEQWKNVSIGVLNQMESALKVTEVYTCKNKRTIFYK